MKKINISIIFYILIPTISFDVANSQMSVGFPEVQIAGTQVRNITSSIIPEQKYSLYINLPRNYLDTTKSFPVIYVLDAQWDFALVYALYGEEYYDGFIPGAIVVGITWGGKNPNPDSLRARDFSPTHVEGMVQSGGAPKFLAFIKNELIPFIDANYQTKPNDRTLIGSSFGGLFTLYAMLSDSKIFNRYVLTSPYLGYDNNVINSFLTGLPEKSSIQARLFMAQGELEGGVPQFTKFVDNLKSKKFQGLKIQTKVLEHMGHSGGKAEGYTRGLQFTFARPSLELADNILDQYTGIYELGNVETITVKKENGCLVAQLPGNESQVFHSATETDFYALGKYLNIQVKKNESGKVIGCNLEQFGGEIFLKKIK
jgi:predicted alpha/beta superfamily hydrolase